MGDVEKSQRMVSRDILSNLPDHLLHDILSFLSMEDLAAVCRMSKKFRELCISIPSLILDAYQYKYQHTKRALFIDFLDKFIDLRKGMETKCVSFNWYFANVDSEEEYCICDLLHSIMVSKIESLAITIKLRKGAVFLLRHDVLHSGSLTDLEVNLLGGSLEFHYSSETCKIQSLCLKNITIRMETIGEWVSSRWMYLKKLYLLNVRGIKNKNIKRSTLQHLEIILLKSSEVCSITVSCEMLKLFSLNWSFNPSIGMKLSILAPKLEQLIWGGSFVSSYSSGELKHLEATVFFLTPALLEERNPVPTYQKLYGLLTTCSIKILALHYECLEKLERSLASMPYGFDTGYWASQNLMFIHHMEEVTIQVYDDGDKIERTRRRLACPLWKDDMNESRNKLEFIKYLLRNATQLRMITILDSRKFSSESRREIIECGRASTVDVAFL